MHLKYSSELKVLAFLDNQCSLGTVYLSADTVVGRQVSSAIQEDLDLNEIDAALNDDADSAQNQKQQMDNIDMDEMKDALSDDASAAAAKPQTIKISTEPEESKKSDDAVDILAPQGTTAKNQS